MRKTWWAVAAIVVAACGGPNGNDPGRYGTVRVALAGVPDGALRDAVRQGAEGMSAVGPTVTVVSDAGDVTIEATAESYGAGFDCVALYDPAGRRASLSVGCGMLTPANLRIVAAHVTGHLLGMEHVTSPRAVMGSCDQTPTTMGRFFDCAHGAGAEPTQADIDEYRRTHP